MTVAKPLPWQEAALGLRTHVDLILLAGGRAGGKTTCAHFGIAAHCNELGSAAAVLMVRESFQGLSESMSRAFEMLTAVFGPSVSYNRQDAVIRLPNGATVSGCSLHEGEAAYMRWQGRNLTMIVADEVGLLSPHHFLLMRRLESNLRPPDGFKAERIWCANPGGKAHTTLLRNWIGKAPPWKMARDHLGLSFVVVPSIYTDNTTLDHRAYKRNLIASVGADKALADSWLGGSWANIQSAMFPVNPAVHLIERIPPQYLRGRVRFTCGSDWGSSAPATAVLIGRLKEPLNWKGRRLPYASFIALQDTDTCLDDNDLSLGSGLDPRTFAEQVRDMLGRWDAQRCDVYVDEAKGLQGDSVVGYFRAAELHASVPDKGSRTEGWDIIRQHLAYAENGKGPPLYFTEDAQRTFRTVCEAPRGMLNPRDVDPKWNEDHHADALRYAMKAAVQGGRVSNGRTVGHY